MALYHGRTMDIDETHPGLKVNIEVERTENTFSGQPTDLTLEQSINADAAQRMPGITCLRTSLSARQRCSRSHGICTSMIFHVLNETGLQPEE
ncbi:hypothetical protein JTB14_026101 [Gonioctena quinquepunctata]|nr:hypothetical protein JTB14_026101 [Gonioctena quinquepunctata]